MNEDALKLFHELMKKGYIDRNENSVIWSLTESTKNMEDLSIMGEELAFDIIAASNRYYLVPTQDNDLFLKNNMDYRKDINAANSARANDLLLMNYLAVYILYLFFHGEKEELQIRDYITKEDLIVDFNTHCQMVVEKDVEEKSNDDYSENFKQLAQTWMGKKEGNEDSRKFDERYGIINRLLVKFRVDELFTEIDNQIKPTRKCKDLMPYVLRKDRVVSINQWMEEREKNATD